MSKIGNWVIKNGVLVSPEWGNIRADLLIENGKVASIGGNLTDNGSEVYDAKGKYVFPGIIDPHVHIGNYNDFEADCCSETLSACAGGVTTVVTYLKVLRHVNAQVSYHNIFDDVFKMVDELSSVDVAFHCVVSTHEHVSEIAEYVQKGASSFKFYLGYRGSEKALKRGAVGIDDGLIYASFLEIAKAGPPAIACVHAENEEVIHFFENKIQDKHKMRFIDWANSRPNFSEAESVSRACYLAGNATSPLYLCHVSAKESLEMVRKMGSTSPLYVETCVHYLTLSKEEGDKREGAVAKVIPPLRERESVEALWRGIDQGWIHTIGTDHIALKKEKKMEIWEGDPGFPGVETLLPLVLTQAMQRNIALQKIARVCSMNPAQIFGLYPTKGTIRPGADADIVIVELEKPYRIKSDQLHSKGDFSPFEGMEVNAKVEATWLRGNLVYQAGGELKERMGKKILRNQRGTF